MKNKSAIIAIIIITCILCLTGCANPNYEAEAIAFMKAKYNEDFEILDIGKTYESGMFARHVGYRCEARSLNTGLQCAIILDINKNYKYDFYYSVVHQPEAVEYARSVVNDYFPELPVVEVYAWINGEHDIYDSLEECLQAQNHYVTYHLSDEDGKLIEKVKSIENLGLYFAQKGICAKIEIQENDDHKRFKITRMDNGCFPSSKEIILEFERYSKHKEGDEEENN